MLSVTEIFASIQGESSFAGWPCAFVRLSGCNLRCSYCDTLYAYEAGKSMDVGEIVERVSALGLSLVEVTGGEPLIQSETPQLIAALLDTGSRVLLETNGSRDISVIDERCVRIVDFKCPSSGEAEANDLENIGRLSTRDEVKLVIGSREDYSFARRIVRLVKERGKRSNTIHFSPVFGRIEPRELVEWILSDRLSVHLNLQLHKVIWSPDARGV